VQNGFFFNSVSDDGESSVVVKTVGRGRNFSDAVVLGVGDRAAHRMADPYIFSTLFCRAEHSRRRKWTLGTRRPSDETRRAEKVFSPAAPASLGTAHEPRKTV
jgi:hypothetical protein